jgi:hypothetical protein
LTSCPPAIPAARTVRFRAGLELSILHLGLWLLTFAVRLRLIRSLRPLAAALRGGGGMVRALRHGPGRHDVEVLARTGRRARPRAVWSLTAEAGDGPNIPVLPALALVRGLLQGQVTATGARVAGDLLPLAAIEREFGRFRIAVRRDVGWPQANGLFERVLGPDFALMPPLVRRVHGRDSIRLSGPRRHRGRRPPGRPMDRAAVRVSRGVAGRACRRAPEAAGRQGGLDPPLRPLVLPQHAPSGPFAATPLRTVRPFTFELEIAAHADGFTLAVVGWRMGFVRLPASLAPRSPARAFLDGERPLWLRRGHRPALDRAPGPLPRLAPAG